MLMYNLGLPPLSISFPMGGSPPPSEPEWQIGDRFRGKISGRTGEVVGIERDIVSFIMDDYATPGVCNISKFTRYAERISNRAHSVPPPPTDRICTTCTRTCDVGRCCWWCETPDLGVAHGG